MCVFVSTGMIRLPKATKAPLKSKLIPRQSLAIIVKDLGERREFGSACCPLTVTDLLHVVFCSLSLSVSQPSLRRSDSRLPADPRRPSTGTRPASREWARACWGREASIASVVAPHDRRGRWGGTRSHTSMHFHRVPGLVCTWFSYCEHPKMHQVTTRAATISRCN